jgi:tRNA threonylcarbamoyladenosine biosynthesis protein TsaB
MKILLIDTCGAAGSLALADTVHEPTLVISATLPGRSAAERLVPAIRSLADDSCISFGELDAVSVVHGPGSFTGVRVGLSAAKGLCHALGLPLVAISRLAVLASLCPKPTGVVYALLDAGRGEFYLGLYTDGV